jgi:hypothetical protein
MSALTQKLQDTFGFGRWQGTTAGIVVDGQLVIPKAQLGAWLQGQFTPGVQPPAPVMPPIARPKPRVAPKPKPKAAPETAPTPMPFAKPPPKAKKAKPPAKAAKAAEAKPLVCPKCNKTWEDCDCGNIWCPYCDPIFEPPSGTQRGLDLHVRSKHKDVDW